VHSEYTIQREAEDSFYIVSSGAGQRLDHDWIKKHMPDDGSVRFDNLTNSIGVLVLAGPRARDILQKLTRTDLGNEAFGWLSSKMIDVNMAPVMAFRMNYVGELGWELHHPMEYQNHIFDALMEAGAEFQLKPFGIRAMDAMRLEKSYRMIGTELSIEYAALESGLHRFVHLNKGQFIGSQALIAWQEKGFANSLVTIEVHDAIDADVIGGNPIMLPDGHLVGRATSGGYGFRVGKSLAMAMVRPDLAASGTQLMIDILDQRLKATVIDESPYDPDNAKLRA
jgi:dimethylglycine dehydrogenase